MRHHSTAAIVFCLGALVLPARAADLAPSRADVLSAMKKAAAYYRTQVATRGGYVYYYSLDLKQRWGEGVATADQIWVQPPGTPTVGTAYLAAWRATGDAWYLDAATETARALVYGQLTSGGWTNAVDFAPKGSRSAAYRNGRGSGKANSTLDDNTTQSALGFLIETDQALEFKDKEIHEAAKFGLDALLAAQFANGGFPQVYTGPAAERPVVRATYPDYDWRTENRVKEYWTMATLNDGLAGDVARTLITAHEVYQDERAASTLRKLGDFLILAQLPDPQPAWAQQYDAQMRPIWARKFEPPAVSGHESQDAMRTLMTVYRQTNDPKYLEPISRALAYLRKSQLPDGRLARFYELKTNKPLYMTKKYELTYDDSDLPTHYGFKVASHLDRIEKEYDALKASRDAPAKRAERSKPSAGFTKRVEEIVRDLDAEGRWVSRYEEGRLTGAPKMRAGDRYLSSDLFSRNLTTLSEFVAPRK